MSLVIGGHYSNIPDDMKEWPTSYLLAYYMTLVLRNWGEQPIHSANVPIRDELAKEIDRRIPAGDAIERMREADPNWFNAVVQNKEEK